MKHFFLYPFRISNRKAAEEDRYFIFNSHLEPSNQHHKDMKDKFTLQIYSYFFAYKIFTGPAKMRKKQTNSTNHTTRITNLAVLRNLKKYLASMSG